MAKTKVKKKVIKTRTKASPYSSLNFAPGFWKRHWKEGILIPLLAFALYWMSLSYGYVLDDQIVITDNQFTKKGIDGIWQILSTESFSGYFGEQKDLVAGARYRPLSIVTFALEHSLFGDEPFLRHFINILLYGLCALIIFRIFSVLLPTDLSRSWLLSVPFITAILFLFHPVHSEVVANIKGRDEIMTAIGALGALFFALRYLVHRNIFWLIASGISMFLGLMSKENAITFLAVIPLTLYFFTNARRADYLWTLLPSFIASVIYLIIRTNVIGYFLDSGIEIRDLMNNPFVEMNGSEKMATIMYTLGYYLKLLIFPHPLTHDYYPYHIPVMDFSKAGTLVSLLIYLALAVIFFWLWKRKSIYAWSIGFFVITISIVSNILFPVGTFMNERFLFIPSIAFSLVCAWFLIRQGMSSPKPWLRYGSIALLVLLLAGYTLKTYDRVPAWKDSLSLNGQAALVSENSARANCFMATALYEEGRDTSDASVKQQLFQEAEYYAKRALSIYPSYLAANQIYSGLVAERYQRDGDLERLLREFAQILEVRPETEYVYQFSEYLNSRAPADRMTDFYYHVGYEILTVKNKKYPFAVRYLQLGEALSPNDPRILFGLGKAFFNGGDQVQGTNYLNKAYQLNPSLRALN